MSSFEGRDDLLATAVESGHQALFLIDKLAGTFSIFNRHPSCLTDELTPWREAGPNEGGVVHVERSKGGAINDISRKPP